MLVLVAQAIPPPPVEMTVQAPPPGLGPPPPPPAPGAGAVRGASVFHGLRELLGDGVLDVPEFTYAYRGPEDAES